MIVAGDAHRAEELLGDVYRPRAMVARVLGAEAELAASKASRLGAGRAQLLRTTLGGIQVPLMIDGSDQYARM